MVGKKAKLELAVRRAAKTGDMVDLRTGIPGRDEPAQGETWSAHRSIPANVLVDVLTDERGISTGRPRAVRLRGARIIGSLDLEAATLVRPLMLQDCYFDQPVILREANALAVRMVGCQLPGVEADQLRTRDDLDFTGTSVKNGAVNLRGAHVGGGLWFIGASLCNPGGFALFGNLLTVDHSVFCRNGFSTQGEVRLRSVSIASQFNLNGASLSNPDGVALDGFRLRVGSDMFCCDGFATNGELHLVGAVISGMLLLEGARLSNPRGIALSFRMGSATTMGLQLQERPQGTVVLTNAQVGEFHDEPDTWPDVILLRGFKYDILRNDSISIRARLNWLTRHPDGYAPGTYDNLAASYKRAGQIEAARRVAVAKHWHRRQVLKLPGKVWNWLLYVTVGYGYRTWLAGLWLAGLLLVGAAVFADAYPSDIRQATATVPAFQPLAYSLDVLLPVVDLGQQQAWLPQHAAQVWSWALSAAGWVLTTAVIAGISNAMRRE